MSLGASAAKAGESTVWHVTEDLALAMGTVKFLRKVSATLAPDLQLLKFEMNGTERGMTDSTTAVRTEKGFDVTKTTAEGSKSSVVEADTHTIGGLTSLLIFLRHCPAGAATYSLHAFTEKTQEKIDDCTIDVKGAGKFTEGETSIDAWIVSTTLGEGQFDFYFDPADRSPFAIRADGALMQRAGLVKLDTSEIDTSKPAASAFDVLSRTYFAFYTSDEKLLAGAIHWPSLLEVAKSTRGYTGDEAAYKIKMMAFFKEFFFRESFRTLSRAQASAKARSAIKGAKTEQIGDVTVFKFGTRGEDPMENAYTTKSIDGVWYIVNMPMPK